jgi:energy-coupling factor transport system substrate-specific component
MKTQRFDKMTLFLIPIGVAINFVGGQLALLLKLPLYLDAIGTIIVGALCGGIPGAIVGLISNILNSLTYPLTLFYGLLNIAFGLSAGWMSRRGVFLKLWKTLLSTLWYAFVGGGIGAVMTWVLYGFDFGTGNSAPIALTIYKLLGEPSGFLRFATQFIAEFSMDIVDKLLTLLAVFFMLKSMPVKILSKLPLGEVYIKKTGLFKKKETAD